MLIKGIKVVAIIFILILLGILGLFSYWHLKHWMEQRNSPYNKPGTVWTDSVVFLGYGSDLILLDDGTYASTSVCDICSRSRFNRGIWRDKGQLIVLTSSNPPHKEYLLLKALRHNCEFLQDTTPNLKTHPTFFKKSSKVCAAMLLHEQEKAFKSSGL